MTRRGRRARRRRPATARGRSTISSSRERRVERGERVAVDGGRAPRRRPRRTPRRAGRTRRAPSRSRRAEPSPMTSSATRGARSAMPGTEARAAGAASSSSATPNGVHLGRRSPPRRAARPPSASGAGSSTGPSPRPSTSVDAEPARASRGRSAGYQPVRGATPTVDDEVDVASTQVRDGAQARRAQRRRVSSAAPVATAGWSSGGHGQNAAATSTRSGSERRADGRHAEQHAGRATPRRPDAPGGPPTRRPPRVRRDAGATSATRWCGAA